MPNRILRAELLESEGWLALKDNSDRAAWIACFLTVDTLGDMPAGPQRLVKLWRPFGIDTPEKAAKVCGDLVDADLVRRYTVNDKPYLHIPRFKQSRRFLGHLWPLSPWATDEEKQAYSRKSQVNPLSPHVTHGDAPIGVGVGVGVGVELKTFVGLTPDPPPKDLKGKALRDAAKRVLESLNRNAGRRYEPVDANLKPILARFQEGYSEQDLRAIAAVKARQWKGDEKMEPYIRPKTLFNATNAAQYRAELPANQLEENT